ncbi:hypothetical protein BT69DRAFT_1331726 [Atractiella rhizophila]|nr:hypothetical protein BT69DRAFT_1331726 [Atractiella rhizophila]
MSDFATNLDSYSPSAFGSPIPPESRMQPPNYGTGSCSPPNDPFHDPFVQHQQNQRDAANADEQELRHRSAGQLGSQATMTGTGRELTYPHFRTVVGVLIAARPWLEQSALPNLLRFWSVLQKMELKGDLMVIACEVRQRQKAPRQWYVGKEMKDYLRQLISELLQAHDLFAYKAKFGDRARKYIEKVERKAGTNIFAAAWTLDPLSTQRPGTV